MKSVSLLLDLLEKGMMLWAESGELCFRAPPNVLSASVRQALSEHKRELVALLGEGRKHVSPSFAQARLWFLDRLTPGTSLYNVPATRRLTALLDRGALEQSLNEIVRRHQILRTTFVALNGQPVQVIAPTLRLPLPVIDLRELPQTQAQELADQEAQRPFDLARGPLLRATLLQLGEEEHLLLLTMHHIVSDGWSMDVFFRELATLYDAFSAGQPSPLPELPLQYADFTMWQREWLRGNVLEKQLTYWKRQLRGAPGTLALPTDRPRPTVQSFQGAIQSLTLSGELSQGLRLLSQREGTTLFMTLLAAFKLLLYRYSGQDDVVLGTPVANRDQAETEDLIGFFVNTLVLRTNLAGNPSFRELLKRVRDVCLEAYGHQDLPFEILVEELQPRRDPNRNPLFQVMFTLESDSAPSLELPGASSSSLGANLGTAKFDLLLTMQDRARGLSGHVEYSTDLFDPPTITRMLGHFQVLLQAIVANPEQRLSELSLLTEAERHRVLVEWNDTWSDYPRDRSVHELFEAQAARTPQSVAVVFEDNALTYDELNRRANQLAHHLRALGVGPQVIVGICVERSLEMIVGTLAILKAGGTYLPLDPTDPQERLAFLLQDTQAPLLLTQQQTGSSLPQTGVQAIRMDADWQVIARQKPENPACGITGEHPAYVMYTSGSTGQPKGALVPHRAISRLAMNTNYISLQPNDCVAQIANAAFDAITFEIWGALLNGARVVIMSKRAALSPTSFATQIREQKINVLFLTTALFNQFAQQVPDAFRSVRHVLFGGETVNPNWVSRVLEKGAPEHLLHVYGPTESTTFASWYLVRNVTQDAVTVPIGRPLSNTQMYLLDDDLRLVPVGVPGEIYIGGDGLALGYLYRSQLTAERFIPDPFSQGPGARLYRTGDLARYLPDGNVEFLGRIDHQVKIRGFRIELGEIEAVLGQHPAVRETVVLARNGEREPGAAPAFSGEKHLVAYVVPGQERLPPVSQLRGFLKQKLPEYMIPATFVTVDALPLTPSGKVDRRALPAPEGDRPELEKAFVAPRTPTEETLAGIWAQLLDLQRVGVHDNFFDLGGHSLLATRVVSRVRDAFQIELPLLRLFETPTVAELAQSIDDDLHTTPSTLVAITPRQDFEEIEL